MDLRWDDLRVLLAVARSGTLAAAAEDLGLSAPTLHRRVAALEAALGAALFEKAPRGYTLTPLGEVVLPHAEAVAEAVHGLTRAVTGHDRAATGPVRIAVAPDLVPLLAPHLALLARHCPGVVPVLRVGTRFVDLGRETDVAIRVSERAPDDAIAHRVGASVWCRYAQVADPDLPWAIFEGRDALPAVAWRKRHLPDVKIAATVDEIGAMADALASLPAQGLLPTHLGDADARLVRIGQPIDETRTPIWLLVHVDLRRSAKVRAFLDVVLPSLTRPDSGFAA